MKGKVEGGKVVLTALAVAATGCLATNLPFYREALVDPFFALALASVVILHFRTQRKWVDPLLVVIGMIALAAIDFRILHYAPRWMAWFAFSGLASFLVMSVRTIWAKGTDRKTLLCAWVPAALFVASDYFASTMLAWTGAAHPKTLDLYLLSFDYSLRVPLVFVAGRIYALHPWLHNISLLAYVGLAIPIAVVYAGRLARFKAKAFPAMLAFLITGPLGVLFYNLFPACGPRALFRLGFPFHPFPMSVAHRLLLEPMAIAGPRNAMPSLHLAWTLLAWLYSRGLSWTERLVAFAFLALTAFATLGTGEHWFVDLIVAFPFALLIEGICAYGVPWNDASRLAALLFGLLGTLGWLVMLRFGTQVFWTSPAVSWALAVGTVAITGVRQMKLDQAVDERAPGARDQHDESASRSTSEAALMA